MIPASWEVTPGRGPVVAVALHDGHDVRAEVADLFAITELERWREEDPFTGSWTTIGNNRIIGKRSRFEFDLNRHRDKAIYLEPEDAWGLTIWQQQPTPEIVERSLAEYDAFYATAHRLFTDLERQFGRFIVFDLHTYNHRRFGPQALPEDPRFSPEVNLGTGTLDRRRWAAVVETFLTDLQSFDFLGRQLDVRENIKFWGGHFPYWVHQTFPHSACVLSVEVKKFFMDEWTNEPDQQQIAAICRALESTVPGALKALKQA